MPRHRPVGWAGRQRAQERPRPRSPPQTQSGQSRSQIACRCPVRRDRPSLNLRRGCIGGALVVDPAYLEVVTLPAALEREFYVRVLGDRAPPVCNEYGFAVVFEGEFLDEMRRNKFALGVLDN